MASCQPDGMNDAEEEGG